MDNTYRIPKGWFITGDAPTHPDHYEIGVDPTLTYENRPCVTIKAGPDPIEFAGLAQEIKAEAYQGKRLRFSAALRSVDLENRAALFMRMADVKLEVVDKDVPTTDVLDKITPYFPTNLDFED